MTSATCNVRFDAKYVPEPNTGCWLWIGCRGAKDGYGHFMDATGKQVMAHRYSYERHVGPIPADLVLDHVKARGCIGPECVNPDHLQPVTQRENVRRGKPHNNRIAMARRRLLITHCPKGHSYDQENSRFKANGRRYCGKCAADYSRGYYRSKGEV